jgi:hypothetical protein
MPDFGHINYKKDGRVVITGNPEADVASWKKNPREGWDITCTLPGMTDRSINALPRSAANTTLMRWHAEAQAAAAATKQDKEEDFQP